MTKLPWTSRQLQTTTERLPDCAIRIWILFMKPLTFLLKGNLDYEFRTTVIRELHNEKDFIEIGQWLKGAKAYYLQAYKDSEEVLQPGFSSYSLEELEHFRSILHKYIPLVEIRGTD